MNNEVSSILRLNGWAGRAVLLFYGVGTTVIAIVNLDGLIQPLIGYLALVLMWAGLTILGMTKGEPLGIWWTIGVLGIVAVTTAISSGNVPDVAHSAFATWPIGAMVFLLFVLALRGRRGYAWIGFAAFAAIMLAVAFIANQDLAWVINSILRQSGTLIIGTLFAIALRRATESISAIQAGQVKRSTLAAVAGTAAHERAIQNSRLELDTRPALERIIAEEPFTANDLRHFALLESSLRDGIQAAGFSGERIAEATRRARIRGLRVTLLDDRGTDLSPDDRARVESVLLQQLADTGEGSVMALLSPEGRDEIATIVVEEGGRFRRVRVTPTAVEVSHPLME
jgi:hypothetical protein